MAGASAHGGARVADAGIPLDGGTRWPQFSRAVGTLLDADFPDLIGLLVSDAVLRHVASSARSLRAGGVAEAEAEGRRALAAARTTGWEEAMPLAAATLARALCERGALVGARRVLHEAGATAQLRSCPSVVPVLFARARLSRLEGEPRDALADARAVGSMQEHYGLAGTGHPWRFEAALALFDLGDRTEASKLAAFEWKLAQADKVPRRIGMALHALALTSGGERRLRHLRAAERVLSAPGAPVEHAAVLVDLGGALRRAGQRVESRGWLYRGLELARACGAAATTARAEAELASSCERLRREPVSGVDALTPTERRVAGLAAEGLTNPEVAKTLSVSIKTVESHLSRAFRKLDIRSRNALPALLRPDSRPEVPPTLQPVPAPVQRAAG